MSFQKFIALWRRCKRFLGFYPRYLSYVWPDKRYLRNDDPFMLFQDSDWEHYYTNAPGSPMGDRFKVKTMDWSHFVPKHRYHDFQG